MAGEAMVIARSRARRAVVSHFTSAGAFSAAQAIPFAPRNDGEAHALGRLIDAGYIRQEADGRYHADRERLTARGKRRWAVLAGLAAVAAGIALFD